MAKGDGKLVKIEFLLLSELQSRSLFNFPRKRDETLATNLKLVSKLVMAFADILIVSPNLNFNLYLCPPSQ
jgi:hypothetical protein